MFTDHFSVRATDYSRYRPTYPDALFACLAARTPQCDLAWDCATGNGQAARGLAAYFRQVIATDASAAQVAHGRGPDNVGFAVAPAENSPLAGARVDLVTVAQALHWLNLEAFYGEVRRVLRPGGVVAAWCYGLFAAGAAVDRVIGRFYREVVGPYWPPERQRVDSGYAGLPFPFEPLPAPTFGFRREVTMEELLGYLGTWSAVQCYRAERGSDPLMELVPALERAWPGTAERIGLQWTLHLLLGRVPAAGDAP